MPMTPTQPCTPGLLRVALLLLISAPLPLVVAKKATSFTTAQTKPKGNLRGLSFVSRFLAPFGPPLGEEHTPNEKLKGYGYGVGAIEAAAYDEENRYLYTASKQGYVSVVDYAQPAQPTLTDIVLDFSKEGEISDVKVCPSRGWLFVSNVDAHTVQMYETVKRNNPTAPTLIATTEVSLYPDSMLPNDNCTILAVSHERNTDLFYGVVTLVRNLDFQTKPNDIDQPTATAIPLDNQDGRPWDDEYVLRKGLHMPLTRRAMEYWDLYSDKKDRLDFSKERSSYRSSLFLQGEYLAWTPNQQEVLVNLQANNGLLRLDVAHNRPSDLAGYGLKDHADVAIDINGNDQDCNLLAYPNLFSMRNPDAIETFRYNGRTYVLTANEGKSRTYNGFADAVKAKELFVNETFALPFFSTWPSVFDPNATLGGPNAASFNANCQGLHCVGDVKISLGSSAIDYEVDPTNPVLERMVLFGGRGWTVYELPENTNGLLKLVYDSGDSIEREICRQLPWAHNTVQDDGYAPVAGFPNNTLWQMSGEEDRQALWELNDPKQDGCEDQGDGTPGACPYSQTVDRASVKDGQAMEMVVSGVACGRLVSLVTTEKSGIALLYDITDITAPALVQMVHLSPGTKDKSPGLAYNGGTIGDVDPEIAFFLDDSDSPSGNAGVFIVGAHSGTVSFWEFDCADKEPQLS